MSTANLVSAAPSGESAALLERLLGVCVQRGASDLHLAPGVPPCLRVHGILERLSGEPVLGPRDLQHLADLLLTRAAPEKWLAKGAADGALPGPQGSRFRFNVFRRHGQVAIALRRLEDRFRTLGELGLTERLYELCDLRDGLVIVCGPTGHGKSTTLAALLDRINQSRSGHIVTIEDPIEYVHEHGRSVVNQRQVGSDAPSFNDALVASLRQDPDVILVGEIRDLDTIRTAITAAETGHLVLTTLHAGNCVGAVERLVSVFPADEQDGIRRQLSLVLRAVAAQHLLPTVRRAGDDGDDRPGRVVASEVLRSTPAVANLIATGKSAQLYSAIEAGRQAGMQTLEQDLARLWVSGVIDEAVAVATAHSVPTLRDRADLLRRGGGRGDALGLRPATVGGYAR